MKKFAAIAVAASMFALAACGEKAAEEATTDSAAAAADTAAMAADTAAAAADSAATAATAEEKK
jgi:predicted small lipoprotein YifL